MPDVLGWRKTFGAIGPSTNTVVQPDFDAMRPVGVTNHYSRIFTPNSTALSNETFRAGIATISDNVMDAVKSVMTCAPDYLVMGMSAITFFGGAKGPMPSSARCKRRQALASASAAIPPPPRSRPTAASSALPSYPRTGPL